MRGFAFEDPVWLWLLALAPAAAWIGLTWLTRMTRIRRITAVAARALLIALLAGVLAGVSTVQRTDRMAVVFVIDASESVRTLTADGARPLETARALIERAASARGPDDLVGIVSFAARPRVVTLPTRSDVDSSLSVSETQGTDIASAIRQALTTIPPDAKLRLVLVSDGNQTSGDAMAAASEAAAMAHAGGARGVRIDVLPVEYSVQSEVIAEFVDVPGRAAAGGAVPVRIGLRSAGPASGRLSLLHNDQPIRLSDTSVTRAIELAGGMNIITAEVPLGEDRLHRFRAVFEPDSGDTYAQNNAAEGFTVTPGEGSVLIVDGVGSGSPEGPGATLAGALEHGGLTVSLAAPSGLPANPLDLHRHDLVILQNVPADEISPEKQALLTEYVRDMGGGLVMIGGPDSFGPGGWIGTELADILPVDVELPDKLVEPEAAIMFVLDKSGSMNRSVMGSSRTQQRIANDSAAMAITRLSSKDLVGVIAFSDTYRVVVPLAENTDPESAARRVRGISSDGGTSIADPLWHAAEELGRVEAKVKHIVLLSDGESDDRDRLASMAGSIAARGITISAIAMGDEADLPTMQQIARRGEGEFYEVLNPAVLPDIFLKAIRVVRSPMVRRGVFSPVILRTSSPVTSGLGQPPTLEALVMTQPRSDPRVTNAMVGPEGLPLLAHWNVGLGRSAAFTSDAHAWARAWLQWPGYERFWTQLATAAMRSVTDSGPELSTEMRDGRFVMRLEATDEAGRPIDSLRVPASITTPAGTQIQTQLTQTGPGMYEGSVEAKQAGVYVAVVTPRRGAGDDQVRLSPAIGGASAAAGDEMRRLASDTQLMRAIARRTGGRVLTSDPDPTALFDRAGTAPVEAMTSLWRPLLIWAIVVLLLDIATRRVAWDRYFTSAAEREELARLAATDRRRGAAAGAVTGVLRSRHGQSAAASRAGEAALSESDAAQIASAQARRRIQERLAAAGKTRHPHPADESPAPPAPIVQPTKEEEPQGPPSLQRAKERARHRFEADTDSDP